MNNLVLLLEEDGVDEAEDAEDDDADVDGERGHGLVAEVHVAAAEAVDHVGDGLVAVEVLLVGVLEPGPQLLEAPALGLLRQRPVVEPPRLLPAQHVVRLPQPDEPLRRLPQRQRRRVRVVLLGQPPVRRLYLLDVRLRFHPQEPGFDFFFCTSFLLEFVQVSSNSIGSTKNWQGFVRRKKNVPTHPLKIVSKPNNLRKTSMGFLASSKLKASSPSSYFGIRLLVILVLGYLLIFAMHWS